MCARTFEENSPPDLMKDFAILREKVSKNPRDVASLNSMGIIYAKSGKLDDAIKIWKYALDIDPRYIHLYNNLGSALKQLGRKSEARIIFKIGLGLSDSYWIYYNLGLLEKEDGNVVAATNCFKACLKRKPGFQPAISKLAELGHYQPLPPMNRSVKPMSLGSYKPPVSIGNIDLYPLYPNGIPDNSSRDANYQAVYGNGKTRNNLATPFVPLTLASCTSLIKSFNAAPADKFIALTFDDGPHSSYTPELLNLLKRNGVKATFFVVGARAETYPELVMQMSSEGHAVGNHTWNHKSLTKSTNAEALESLRKTNDLISGLTGKPCLIVRPPFGNTSPRVKQLIHNQGWHEIMWDCDSRDWENNDPDRILFRVMKSVSPRSIILFHDIHPGAAKMLQTLITAFKSCGYRFVTIPELIEIASGTS
ncbi:MAG: hypothetical protein Kow0029_23550 [Candidatus Rifleibacteriota bacterium]